MKIPIILLIFVMFFGTFFIDDSNALIGPSAPREDPSIPEVRLQIVIRNSEGMLVNYIEPSIFYFTNVYLLHQHLNEKEDKTIITIDGKNYEQIKFEYHYIDRADGQRASYSLWEDGFSVLTSRFNGYLSEPGDTMDAIWTITRTI